MSIGKGFCDLNIWAQSQFDLKETVLKALSLGYQTVAISQYVMDTTESSGNKEGGSSSKKRKKGQGADGNENLVPPPVTVNLSKLDLQRHKITREPVILTRITIEYSDPASPFLSKYANAIKQYDLVAVVPKNDVTLMQIVKSKVVDVDILSLIPDTNTYLLSRHLLRSAVERDIYFEICYSPCLLDAHSRKQTIVLSHYLHRTSRSANIIITSQASRPAELRYPYDVMNVGRFLGLSELAAVSSIGNTAHNAIYCARARRRGISKCVVQITVLGEEPQTTKFEGLENPNIYLRNVNGVDGPPKKKHKKPEKKVTQIEGILQDILGKKKNSKKMGVVSTKVKKNQAAVGKGKKKK